LKAPAGNVLVPMLVAALFAAGCGSGEDDTGRPGEADAGAGALAYPATLSPDSTPTQVAEALIEALDEKDTAALMGLVAVEAGVADIKRIFSRHGKKSNVTPQQAARLAVSGWRATYALFAEGETKVTKEKAEANTATVLAVGRNKRTDTERTLAVRLVREDNLWKVKPGLNASER